MSVLRDCCFSYRQKLGTYPGLSFSCLEVLDLKLEKLDLILRCIFIDLSELRHSNFTHGHRTQR